MEQEEINDIGINVSKGDYVGRDPYLFTNIKSSNLPTNINSSNPPLILQGDRGHSINSIENNDLNRTTNDFGLSTNDLNRSSENLKIYDTIYVGNGSIGTNLIPTYANEISITTSEISSVDSIPSEVTGFLDQISRTRGAAIKLFPIEQRLNKLVKLRQPSSIFNYKVEKLFLTIPFLLSSFSFKVSPQKEKETVTISQDDYQEYYDKLSEVEGRVDKEIFKNPESSKEIKQILERTNTKVNRRVAVNNDLFISLLYSVSSTQELVANMVSKIGHIELQEEAEMHLSSISQLGDVLNRLMDKLNVYRVKEEENKETNIEDNQQQDYQVLIANLVDSLGEDELKNNASLLKSLTEKLKGRVYRDNQEDKSQNSESIYILSDEAQAAVGIMTEIEERKLLVEKLVQIDSFRKRFTSALVTAYVAAVIALAIWGYSAFNPNFELGSKPLSDLKVPLIGVPWPVITWSLIGSFAAMIYRFNRQPIHDFGNAVKWMITRPVQGVVLGSAFYLVLVSGLFLFTGNTSTSPSDTVKAGEEVILVLSFLVGFSDRFADTVFNTLIDRYSKETKNQESKTKTEDLTSEN